MYQAVDNFKKKKHHLFCLNFKEHVRQFIGEHELIHPDKLILLSVSGGVDSMVLLDLFASLGVRFEVIHFNHGTRKKSNAQEELLVKKMCQKLGVKYHIFHLHMSLNEKSFEASARSKRQKIYQRFLQDNYWIYTAHHIDDSFEWSLMQGFKQSGMKSTLGIPLFNNGIVRPFMCVSKKHILRFARAKKILWLEDASNLNQKFERNFLRQKLTKDILKRYPKALKHYVSRHNQLAHLKGLHRSESVSDLQVIKEESGGVVLISKDLYFYKNEIKDWIHKFSSSTRGEIDGEVTKLLRAQKENFPFKGPMNFSGGVSAYLIKDHLFIGNQEQLKFYTELDLKLKNYLENLSQIPERALSLSFPLILLSGKKPLSKSSKFVHPLMPVTCEWLKNHGISYVFTPLLPSHDRQMLAEGALILDSSVRGL